ncbi:hypothetical protein POF50_011360 [Streptomyces sp. SL13]|uniref:Uncharacterized protein n=1 Tax=Streptantibioticus silvisoli TaxID=2705255 RepID=A0AA90K8U9_9ACTN|nr:hypothetical protein [Streptantibioticus silvisoli]MDI5969927.1 hypothetical protein [Streptantibioticus silvisoli]
MKESIRWPSFVLHKGETIRFTAVSNPDSVDLDDSFLSWFSIGAGELEIQDARASGEPTGETSTPQPPIG